MCVKVYPPSIKLLNYARRRAQKLTLHTIATCGLQLRMLSLFLFTQFVVLGMLVVAGVLLVVVHCTEFSIHMFPLVFLHSFFAFRARFRILGWPLVFLLFLFTFRTRLGIPLLVFVLFFFCFCSLLESTVSLALESEMENCEEDSELGWENAVASGEINVKLCSCRNVSCAGSLFIKFCSCLEASNDCSLLALSDLSLQALIFL